MSYRLDGSDMDCVECEYVRVSHQHLWWAVLQRATEGVEEFSRLQQGSGAEVNQSDVEIRVYDDIFILYVPM